MIHVTILQDSDKTCRGIDLDGHAGYGEHGQDIVCAAVSILALNMVNSVEAFTEDRFEAKVEEESGSLRFRFRDEVSPESKLLVNSLILGLQGILSSYGKRYITIQIKEV